MPVGEPLADRTRTRQSWQSTIAQRKSPGPIAEAADPDATLAFQRVVDSKFSECLPRSKVQAFMLLFLAS